MTEGSPGPSTVTAVLGAFVAEWTAIPEVVRHAGRRALLNGFGTAIGSAGDAAVLAAIRTMQVLSPGSDATLIGRRGRLDVSGAAFANAVAMNLIDFDDTHLPTIIHPTAPVAPVALALGEQREASGADVLTAFILGAEVECRIGNMVSPGHYARGWHITSTCGCFGSAAASSRLLGLDARRTMHALGIAASLSSGIVENLPTGGKNASVGNAARNGILASLLAREGYEAAPTALEGRLGWARASGDDPDVERSLSGLGNDWEIELNACKPYPAGIVFHSVIDAALRLRSEHGLIADAIQSVVVSGDALLLARGDRIVANERDARVSLHHAAAVAFLAGKAGVVEFQPEFVHGRQAVEFRSRVVGALDETLPPGASRVDVTMSDGRRLTATVTEARGSHAHPMLDSDVESKVRELALSGRGANSIQEVIDLTWRIDHQQDLRTLMRAVSSSQHD